MPRLLLPLALVLALGLVSCSQIPVPATAVAPAPPWPHEISDLKPDPAVVWGRLENGLRYAILPHATPRERVSVFLLVQVGSYHEQDHERGYAHFIEHMAFRDTRDFPGSGVAHTLQRLGVPFGAHVNAATTPFWTEYRLSNLPTSESEALATGLKILRAMADRIRFEPAAVKQERNVIFSEQRSHTGSITLAQAWRDELEFIAPRAEELHGTELFAPFSGTRLTQRAPIGTEKTLRAASPSRLRAFYERWYRPERMVLTIAGDVTPAEAEQLVRQNFSTLAGLGQPPDEIPLANPAPLDGSTIRIFGSQSDMDPAVQLSLVAMRPHPAPDNSERRQQTLKHRVALAMLERRLDRAAEAPEAPFLVGAARLSHAIPGRELSLVRATAHPDSWLKALTALDLEARRAVEQGFNSVELEQVVKREATRAAAAARQAAHRPASELAQALAFAVSYGVVFTSPEDERRLIESQLALLTSEHCQTALGELLPRGKMALGISGPVNEANASEASIIEALKESETAELIPPDAPTGPKLFPYSNFGTAGRVVQNDYHAAMDADLIQFANGVRLNLKRTEFEPNRFRLNLRFGGGGLAAPAHKPGIEWWFLAWFMGGLLNIAPDEERAAMAGLGGSLHATVTASEFRLNCDGEATHLHLALQNLAAYFAHPAFREEAGPRAIEAVRQQLAPYGRTATGVAGITMNQRMSGNHPALRLPTPTEASQRTLDELKVWLRPQLESSPLEIAIVGDFDPAAAIDAVAHTFGALPPRDTADPYAEQRKAKFPPSPFAETISFRGASETGAVSLAWTAPELDSFAAMRRGTILADIFRSRLVQKLRVEMGATYSPVATFTSNDTFVPALTYLECRIDVSPMRAAKVVAAAQEVAANLARNGATSDEFERARQPLVREAESALRDNDWWLDTLGTAQSQPARAEGWANVVALYQSATLDEINALARTLLTPERQCQLIVLPK